MYKMIGADGREYGPVTAEQLRQWIVQGSADAQTRVQGEGSPDWKPLSAFPEFAAALAGSRAAPPIQGAAPTTAPIKVPNYLVQAILTTLCCCLPFGIVAIVFAAQVNPKAIAGDIDGATAVSKKAKMWCWIAFGVGLPIQILVIAAQVVSGLLSGFAQH